MNKFRVISDLHLDVNERFPLKIENKDVFTVICGDTSGTPSESIDWIRENCPNGVGVSGNHLPYNDLHLTIQELRDQLHSAFKKKDSFTYLDCETSTYSKLVDGILFVGSCMYTDMSIKDKEMNQNGDRTINMRNSAWHMNDYHYGIKEKTYPTGRDGIPTLKRISPEDYFQWFKNAYLKIEEVLNKNESLKIPHPVVLVTHHALTTRFFEHNGYVESAKNLWNQRDFNYASYGSDMEKWLKRHTSIKCYCCGHIHDVYDKYRDFYITRSDGTKILVINNARGYVSSGHDANFNKNRYVNTNTWEIEEDKISKEELEQKKKNSEKLLQSLAWFM